MIIPLFHYTVKQKSCEGKITFQECLGALKKVENFKSPGIEGFAADLKKKKWNDIKFPPT
jgi:hypothetical protein